MSSAELEANVFRFEVGLPALSLITKFTSNLGTFFLPFPIPSFNITKLSAALGGERHHGRARMSKLFPCIVLYTPNGLGGL